jgi:hypothetical protein
MMVFNMIINTYALNTTTFGQKNERQNTLDYRFKFKDFSQHSGEKSSIAFSNGKPITFDQQSARQTLHLDLSTLHLFTAKHR